MRISDWSSDVCSSDLGARADSSLREDMEAMLAQAFEEGLIQDAVIAQSDAQRSAFWLIRETVVEAQKAEGGSIKHDVAVPVSRVQIGRASCRERVCQSV